MRARVLLRSAALSSRTVTAALAVALTLLFACLCIMCSWYMLLLKSRHVRYGTAPVLFSCEAFSVLFAVAAHSVLIQYAITLRPQSLFIFLAEKPVHCAAAFVGRKAKSHDDEDRPPKSPRDSDKPLTLLEKSSSEVTCPGSASGRIQRGNTGELRGRGDLSGAAGGMGSTQTSPSSPLLVPPKSTGMGWGAVIVARSHRSSWHVSLVLLVVLSLTHLVVHLTIPAKHRQSQEIILALARCLPDTAAVLAFAVWCFIRVLRLGASQVCGIQHLWNRVRVLMAVLGVLVGVVLTYEVIRVAYSIDVIPHLRMCILDDHECDPCAAEGLQLNPTLRQSWVWPAITPRRLFTFYTGSEKCSSSNWHSIAYLDERSETLVVSSTCADRTVPRIYVDYPENSELHGRDDFTIVEVVHGNKQYHRDLEEKYGGAANAKAKHVIVHRDKETDAILSVEIDPLTLHATAREPQSTAERAARKDWPSTTVFEIKLGESASYYVLCKAIDHEEFFMFPMRSSFQNDSRDSACTHQPANEAVADGMPDAAGAEDDKLAVDEPASNVLIILFDALSRQAVRRSLPKFAAWMQDFHKRHQGGGVDGHIVVEPSAATTLGFSTAANMCPQLTGTTLVSSKLIDPNDMDLMNRTIFNVAKGKYGDTLQTAMTVGYCHDFLEIIINNTEPCSGNGGRFQGIDHYLYSPMCHLEYSGLQGNFQGPYSIIHRCIDGRQVHEYMFDYTEYLLLRQMRRRRSILRGETTCGKPPDARGTGFPNTANRTGSGKFFFDLSYFIDGHEGTHTAITLVDDGLTAFMERLENEIHFFDDPLNTLIFAADHGNHMGHYFEYTNAGRFERTSPAMVFIMHPEVARRIDIQKGRVPGESMLNFLSRSKRYFSPLDFYLTLGDLLNAPTTADPRYRLARIPPTSLFEADARFPVHAGRDTFGVKEGYIGSQHFCSPKEDAAKAEEIMGWDGL